MTRTSLGVAVLAFAIFALGIVAGRVSAAGSLPAYEFWHGLSKAQQQHVLQGAMFAYVSGWGDGIIAEQTRIDSALADARRANEVSDGVVRTIDGIVYKKDALGMYVALRAYPTFSKSVDDYRVLVDDYYTRYAVGRGATIGEVLGCLADTPARACSVVAGFP
jgi:hypothetical protein